MWSSSTTSNLWFVEFLCANPWWGLTLHVLWIALEYLWVQQYGIYAILHSIQCIYIQQKQQDWYMIWVVRNKRKQVRNSRLKVLEAQKTVRHLHLPIITVTKTQQQTSTAVKSGNKTVPSCGDPLPFNSYTPRLVYMSLNGKGLSNWLRYWWDSYFPIQCSCQKGRKHEYILFEQTNVDICFTDL